jgi:hypothetical protein
VQISPSSRSSCLFQRRKSIVYIIIGKTAGFIVRHLVSLLLAIIEGNEQFLSNFLFPLLLLNLFLDLHLLNNLFLSGTQLDLVFGIVLILVSELAIL